MRVRSAGVHGLVLLAALAGSTAWAQHRAVMACPTVEVQSVSVFPQLAERGHFGRPTPQIDEVASSPRTPAPRAGKHAVKLIALGPVLGSMDSPRLDIAGACIEKGFALRVTLARSASFHGSAAKNVIWRPRITVVLRPRRPGAVLQVTWRMRLTTGAFPRQARTPGFPMQKYPVKLTKRIGVSRARPKS
ncbi:MAG TPA: hypothetical protein VNJ52_09315 [Patescibacteria group bacterium]|nr:hypothetical protein [Patescibacteria group bacterium]